MTEGDSWFFWERALGAGGVGGGRCVWTTDVLNEFSPSVG